MLPHAGMAIAFVAFVVEQAPSLADDVSGVVLGAIIVFELAGPLLLRRVLVPVGRLRVVMPRLPLLFSLVKHLDAADPRARLAAGAANEQETPEVLRVVKAMAEKNNITCHTRHHLSEPCSHRHRGHGPA